MEAKSIIDPYKVIPNLLCAQLSIERISQVVSLNNKTPHIKQDDNRIAEISRDHFRRSNVSQRKKNITKKEYLIPF